MDATAELSIALSRISLWSGNISAIDVAALSFTVLILCVRFFAARDHLKISFLRFNTDWSRDSNVFHIPRSHIQLSRKFNRRFDHCLAACALRKSRICNAGSDTSGQMLLLKYGNFFFLKAMRNFSSFILGKLGSNISMNVLQGPVSLVKAILLHAFCYDSRPTSDTI